MEMAVQLLLSTDFNSNKIAEMTGYSDVGYFGKCFKKYYHMSPKEMRKAKGSTKL
jgi:YesN/AraC family two-component response regulator